MAPFRKLVSCLALACALAGCEKPMPRPGTAKNGAADPPSLVFEGFKAKGTLKGVKQWEATATRARIYHGSHKALAEGVGLAYFQDGKPVSQGKANKAEINLQSYDLKAEGSVLLKSREGVLLSTESLTWDNARQQVSTPAKVKVLRGGSVLTGRGLRADRRLSKVDVLEDVKVETESVEQLRKLSDGMR